MAKFAIAEAAFAGIRLLGRKPLAAVVWAMIYIAFLAAIIAPFIGDLISLFTAVAGMGVNLNPQTLLPLLAPVAGFYLLFLLGSLVFGAVISCAVYRAELRPEESGFAYLRLGSEELWVLLVNFVQFWVMLGAQIALAIPLAIVIALVSMNNSAMVGAANEVGQLVIDGVMVWLYLRFSLAAPMTFADRQFRLFDSWVLTRGLGWRLLGVGAIVIVMAIAIYLFLVIIGTVAGISLWSAIPHPAKLDQMFSRPPSEWMNDLAPLLALGGLLVTIAGTLLVPIFIAPWAYIYQRLQGSKVATTFS